MRVARPVVLSDEQLTALEAVAAAAENPTRVRLRARFVLLAARGLTNKEIAAELGTDRRTVGRWRLRFLADGLNGIERNAPRRRRPGPRERVARLIVRTTLAEPPPSGDRWTTRSLAATLGVSRSMVERVWRAYGLRPHLGPPPVARDDRELRNADCGLRMGEQGRHAC